MTDSEAVDALFGSDDTVQEVEEVEEQDTTDLESESDEEEEDLEESESDESEQDEEEEEKSRKGNPEVPLRALRKEVATLKEEVDTANRLLRDRTFIREQAKRLGIPVSDEQLNQSEKKGEEAQTGGRIPDAPYYENSPEGRADKRLDMHDAVRTMPELATNDRLARMVEGQVAIGLSYAQAVREIKNLVGTAADSAKKEGVQERDQQIAKKQRVATKPAPAGAKPSREAETYKRLKGASTQDAKLQAGHDLLFS